MHKKEVLETLITKVHDEDEPLFLLRGRDVAASTAVLRWISEAVDLKVNKKKIENAEQVVLEMLAYPYKRLPD